MVANCDGWTIPESGGIGVAWVHEPCATAFQTELAVPKKWTDVPFRTARYSVFSILVLLAVMAGWLPAAKAELRSPQPSEPAATASELATASQGLSGWVVDPNGRPVAGAQVGLNGDGTPVRVYNGILAVDWPTPVEGKRIIETGTNGQFCFKEKRPDPFYVLAAHERGFAMVSGKEFKKNPKVRLQRWGRIEGQLATGRESSDHCVWMLALPNSDWLWQTMAFRYGAPYGTDGQFVFEKVPAGWFEVGYLAPMDEEHEGFTSRTPVEVKPGQTVQVKVGGQGRTVIGRFLPPANYGGPVYFGTGLRALHGKEELDRDQKQWRRQWQQVSKDDAYAPPNAPIFVSRLADYGVVIGDTRRTWLCLWAESAGRDAYVDYAPWRDVNWRSYTFCINADGSFRIKDVMPGQYDLCVELKRKSQNPFTEPPFAEYRATIQVPAMPEAATNQPFDLGTLILEGEYWGQQRMTVP
jgi:hypothetical protein